MFRPDDLPDLMHEQFMVSVEVKHPRKLPHVTTYLMPLTLVRIDWTDVLTLVFFSDPNHAPTYARWCDIVQLDPVVSEARG